MIKLFHVTDKEQYMKKFLLSVTALLMFSQVSTSALDDGNILNFFENRAIQEQSNKLEKRTEQQTVTVTDALMALADLQNQAAEIDNNVQRSFLNIVSQLSSSQNSAIMQNQINTAFLNKSQDDAVEIMARLIQDYTKTISANKADMIQTLQNMSDAEQAKFLNSLADMSSDIKKYMELSQKSITTAQTIIKTAKKADETVQIIKKINKTTNEIRNTTKSVISLTNQLNSIVKAAGLVY